MFLSLLSYIRRKCHEMLEMFNKGGLTRKQWSKYRGGGCSDLQTNYESLHTWGFLTIR